MQLTYPTVFPKAKAGLLYDASGSPKKISTQFNASEVIPFGRFVAKVIGEEKGIKLPSLIGDQFLGVAELSTLVEESDEYPINSAVPVVKRGRIWVLAEEAVTPDDDVYVRFATGAGGSLKGVVRNDADSGTAVQVAGVKFFESAGAGEYVPVDVNLP